MIFGGGWLLRFHQIALKLVSLPFDYGFYYTPNGNTGALSTK